MENLPACPKCNSPYSYLDGNFLWRDGRWVQGKADYEYVRASYAHESGSWVFHRPHWKRRATASL